MRTPLLAIICLILGCHSQPASPPGVESSSSEATATVATTAESTTAESDGEAQPRTLRTTLVTDSEARTISVATARELSRAIKTAKPGDTIEIAAGSRIEGSFVLPEKDNPEGKRITIKSSRYDEFVEGHRVGPGDVDKMARIANADGSIVIGGAPRANYWKLLGLEIAADGPECGNVCSFGRIGFGGVPATTPEALPHHITFRHCYIHGQREGRYRVGIEMNARHFTVRDCYVSDFHDVGAESQALLAWNSPGPYTICNNYLEGAGENVMFGGVQAASEKMTPADIVFKNNHLYKPLRWHKRDPSWDGVNHTVKNIFEIKNGKRALISGNVFENCWAQGQAGFAIMLTPRGRNHSLEDITFENNIIKNCSSGINTASQGLPGQPRASKVAKNVTIRNNLIIDIHPETLGGEGRLIDFTTGSVSPMENFVIEHNTMLHGGPPDHKNSSFFSIGDHVPHGIKGFVFRNNLVSYGKYGFHGTSRSSGIDTMSRYLEQPYIFSNNGIIHRAHRGQLRNYPPKTIAAADAGFVDEAAGNYRLSDRSPFKGLSSDQQDIGVNVDELVKATWGVVEGIVTPAAGE